ncbi:Citrinin biosynthesis transcriptional activator mrl3 [Fusarium oxysporum f. sp. cubense]|uniref:Citrinin biosynthesis transcriptional activator mrl3 n=1 Tax=Fusarium oxysporum f. sp. cubense TaxID=61366 RepID=A0A559L5C3_FUSOC|nr:Citrinin biosynthesis transcriptional activator mrl3 [Fusarium oxysporum f. sp. cubense]
MAQEIPSRAGSSSNSNEYMHSTGASSQGSTWEEERENEQTSRRISIITTTLSCFQCRARKAKCDRLKPNCSRCVRLGDECVFPNSRQRRLVRKTNPAATLETRVARLEEIITQSGLPDIVLSEPISLGDEAGLDMGWNQDAANINHSTSYGPASNGIPVMQPTAASSQEDPFMMHELIGLGQFEQLPPSHLTERLVALYFDELNQDLPMLHRTRYVTSLHCPAHMRPPMSLQYAVLALAAATRQEFAHLAMPFYQRSRRYAEADEMKGQGEYFTTIAHTQCWCLLAAYESHQLLFSRASVSLSKSVRIAQMLGLHRLDSPKQPTDPPLPPPGDFFEVEERRRTWWVIFCSDRFVSGITGWPALVNDKDIETRLPASDDAFDMGTNEATPFLIAALQGGTLYSPFAGKVLTAHTFHRTLEHTFRSLPNDGIEDIANGPYWIRQRGIDADLSNMILYLPENLRLPQYGQNRNAVVVNVGIHTSVICIHRAALAKIREFGLPADLFVNSRLRLLPSAEQILNALKSTDDAKGAMADHFLVFSAYLAALIFLEDYMETKYLKNEQHLHYILNAMAQAGEKDLFSRSLAIQLASGMKHVGMDSRTIDRVQELPPTPVSIPILAKQDKASSHITFCSILPTKSDDYSISPRRG